MERSHTERDLLVRVKDRVHEKLRIPDPHNDFLKSERKQSGNTKRMKTKLTYTVRQHSPISSRLIRLSPTVQMVVDELVGCEPKIKIFMNYKTRHSIITIATKPIATSVMDPHRRI